MDTEQRDSATDLLRAIVNDVLAVSPATVNITVKMTRDWMPQWPVAQTPADVVLQMHHGNVLWSRFVADVNALACLHGNGWWSEVAFHDLCTDMRERVPQPCAHY